MRGWFLRFREWAAIGRVQTVLFSVPTEGRTLRVLIVGRRPPYRCVIDMQCLAGSDDWPPSVDLGPDRIRDLQSLLSCALRRDTLISAPELHGLFAPLGRWVDDRRLGPDRICLGRVTRRDASLSVLLVGNGGRPASPTSPWSQPRRRIVFRMRWGADIMYGALTDADAEALIAALDQALAYPLAGGRRDAEKGLAR